MNGRAWSAGDKKRLRHIYPDQPTSQVAATLGRSLTSVYTKAKQLGLTKSEAYQASPDACRLRRGDNVGKAFRFLPGHVPANKGLRRPGWSSGRMRETQFKKGTRMGAANNNWKPVGTVMPNGDGYLRIKVADEPESIAGKGAKSTNWEFVHRRVWEAAHGPIPKGYRLWWKDGNHLNCALENLELVSPKEHMARTTIHNLPAELKDTIQLKAGLNRAINRRIKRDAQASTGRPAESLVRDHRKAEG